MKHFYLKTLLLLLLAAAGQTASAYDCVVDGIAYQLNKNSYEATASVTHSESKYTGKVVIPSSFSYKGTTYSVTSIGPYAFQDCTDLTSITIPNSVTSIGSSAFYGCTGLTRIDLPSSVSSINMNAFEDCSGLTSITIPNGVTNIGQYAFRDCTGLKSITIPNSVTSIGYGVFNRCSSLTSITIPNSVTSIGSSAFHGCSSLTSITIPNSVTSIGGGAFGDCTGLTNVTIPNSVTSIGSSAFSGCSSLTSITIPNSVNSIEDYTFAGCTGLMSITIGNSVTSIGESAFYNCTGLTNITIPNSVTDISSNAFSSTKWYADQPDGVVYAGKMAYKYKGTMPDNTTITLEEGTIGIVDAAFVGCTGLTSITIPNGVTNIGQYAFRDCTGLKSITIPNSVTSIGYGVFNRCSSLTSITIPNSVTSIGISAFYGCSSLTSITIPNSVTSIGGGAFGDCTGLTSVTIPNSVTTIGARAFYNCSALASITIGTGVTSIGSKAFEGTKWYDNLPDGLLYAGKVAYVYKGTMPDNTTVVLQEGTTVIANNAFEGCTGLTNIVIPSSVTSIGDKAFSGCNKIVMFCNGTAPSVSWNSLPNGSIAIVPSEYVQTYQTDAYWKYLMLNAAIAVDNTTQTTATLITSDLFTDFSLEVDGVAQGLKPVGNKVKITGLKPNSPYSIYATAKYNDITLEGKGYAQTKTITISARAKDVTNLKATLTGSFDAGDAQVTAHGFEDGNGYADQISLTGLEPGKSYDRTYYVKCGEDWVFESKCSFQTKPVVAGISAESSTTTCDFAGSYSVIDATVTNFGFTDHSGVTELKMTGLDPDSTITKTFYVVTKEGGRVEKTATAKTNALTLTTLQPRVASPGNVIIAAESNIDNAEEKVGFEWRRTDWTDDFKSNEGAAYLYGGTMEGYIRNLNTEKLWKYRPYYETAGGKRYYGEWLGLDPTNTSYFEPTVHTYANTNIAGNQAQVQGYVMRGSDNTAQQGFKYWPLQANAIAHRAGETVDVPADAQTVTATGTVMTATLTGLQYDTDYCIVAFATTTEGETFYGEQLTFRTGADPSGIDDAPRAARNEATEAARYDLQGHRLDRPRRGLNIVRMSDGTVRKVMVR